MRVEQLKLELEISKPQQSRGEAHGDGRVTETRLAQARAESLAEETSAREGRRYSEVQWRNTKAGDTGGDRSNGRAGSAATAQPDMGADLFGA